MRGRRMTKLQKIFLIDFLEKNKDLLHYSCATAPSTVIETKWKVLARDLNSPSLGPSKTTNQWKEVYKDFRSSTRRKCKIIETEPNSGLKMSNIELRFLKLLNVDPPSNATGESSQTSNKTSEERGFVTVVKVEKEIDYEDNDQVSDEDPLVHQIKDNNGATLKRKNSTSIDKNENLQKDYIDWKRNRIEERLHFSSNTSLAVQMENHALQIQNLSTSFEKNAQALSNLANAFDNVATSINNIADKLLTFVKR